MDCILFSFGAITFFITKRQNLLRKLSIRFSFGLANNEKYRSDHLFNKALYDCYLEIHNQSPDCSNLRNTLLKFEAWRAIAFWAASESPAITA